MVFPKRISFRSCIDDFSKWGQRNTLDSNRSTESLLFQAITKFEFHLTSQEISRDPNNTNLKYRIARFINLIAVELFSLDTFRKISAPVNINKHNLFITQEAFLLYYSRFINLQLIKLPLTTLISMRSAFCGITKLIKGRQSQHGRQKENSLRLVHTEKVQVSSTNHIGFQVHNPARTQAIKLDIYACDCTTTVLLI